MDGPSTRFASNVVSATEAATSALDRENDRKAIEQAKIPVGTFSVEGVTVEAFRSGGKWHLRSAGHETTSPRLGTAADILFAHQNPGNVVAEILAWHQKGSPVAPVPVPVPEAA